MTRTNWFPGWWRHSREQQLGRVSEISYLIFCDPSRQAVKWQLIITDYVNNAHDPWKILSYHQVSPSRRLHKITHWNKYKFIFHTILKKVVMFWVAVIWFSVFLISPKVMNRSFLNFLQILLKFSKVHFPKYFQWLWLSDRQCFKRNERSS